MYYHDTRFILNLLCCFISFTIMKHHSQAALTFNCRKPQVKEDEPSENMFDANKKEPPVFK